MKTLRQAKGIEREAAIVLFGRRRREEPTFKGALDDPGRMAVALTRASRMLILVLDRAAGCSEADHWKRLWASQDVPYEARNFSRCIVCVLEVLRLGSRQSGFKA